MAELNRDDVFGTEHFLDKLLADLELMYPQVTPGPQDSIAKIMYKSGQRSVVDYIKSKQEY